MDVTIKVMGGTGAELIDLGKWLGEEDALRGRVRIVPKSISSTELGSLSDTLTVALGTGGMGTILASCLKNWLRTRRTSVTSNGLRGHSGHPHGGFGRAVARPDPRHKR
jgi:hypothetical protein